MTNVIIDDTRVEVSNEIEVLKTLIFASHPQMNEENTIISGSSIEFNETLENLHLIKSLISKGYLLKSKTDFSLSTSGMTLMSSFLKHDVLNGYDMLTMVAHIVRGVRYEINYPPLTMLNGVKLFRKLNKKGIHFKIENDQEGLIRIVETDADCVREMIQSKQLKPNFINTFNISRKYFRGPDSPEIKTKTLRLDQRTHSFIMWCKEYLGCSSVDKTINIMYDKQKGDKDIEINPGNKVVAIMVETLDRIGVEKASKGYIKVTKIVMEYVESLPKSVQEDLEDSTGFSIND